MKGKRKLITGPPGVGKTTLVKKVCELLTRDHKLNVSGFYTQELREHGERKGFDVVTLNGKTSNLAMKSNFVSMNVKQRSPSVGQYSVNIPSFEKTALPTLQGKDDCILIIDEIGKMELFSKPFVSKVRRLFDEHPLNILATIPIARGGKALQLVDEIRAKSDVMLVNVSCDNRDQLVAEVVSQLVE